MTITKSGRGRPSRAYVLAQVDIGMQDLARAGGLPSPTENEQIWRDIWFEEAHHSTAIEGNTLVLKEVRTLLAEGRSVGNKELCEYLDVQGYARAAEWVYSQAVGPGDAAWEGRGRISRTELREIHRLAVGLSWDVCPPDHPPLDSRERAGSWRVHDIAAFADGMVPPPWTEIDARVSDWLAAIDAGPGEGEHILAHLARMHNGFERIHPFRDGNGRAGRLVLNLLLVRAGYPPTVVRKAGRTRYLLAMRRADRDDPGPLAELIARGVKESLDRFLLPNLAGPVKLLPLSALERPGLTVRGLRSAAEKGTLRAQRDGAGRWMSSARWIDEYRAARRMGRPPKAPEA